MMEAASRFLGDVALSDRCCSSGPTRYRALFRTRPFVKKGIALALDGEKVISSVIDFDHFAVKAPAVVNILDIKVIPLRYSC